jgi:hypothetical protein
LTTGTFRDQIIYPQSQAEFLATGKTDHDLAVILEKLHMTHLLQQDGGLDARKEWRDALSGGDKQKIAMARLFYHRPKVSSERGRARDCSLSLLMSVRHSGWKFFGSSPWGRKGHVRASYG